MNIKNIVIVGLLIILITGCPYRSEFILGKQQSFDKAIVGTYVLDSSKFVVKKVILEIDSNANYTLETLSNDDESSKMSGKIVLSSIDNTPILNLIPDELSKYYYFKYDLKSKFLGLRFLSNVNFDLNQPETKQQLDSVYHSASHKKMWAFRMRLKRHN